MSTAFPKALAFLRPRIRAWVAVLAAAAVAACGEMPTQPDASPIVVAPNFSTHGGGGAGGPIFLSGDDADDSGHCQGSACGALYGKALKFIHDNSQSGGTGILAVGVNGANALSALNSWNNPANGGPGAAITHVRTTAAIGSVVFGNFAMIYIPSDYRNTWGGINNAQLAALNARQPDIVDFVNTNGGGLYALTEAGGSGQYGWLPLALTTQNVSHSVGIRPTSEMSVIVSGITPGDLTHGCCYHTAFTGPEGFSGLKVLAYHDHNNNGVYDGRTVDHAMILGGVQVTIQGSIALSPATALLGTGQNHTVTAVAEDGDPLSPAVGVSVEFVVVSGPNAGTTGSVTTDGSGSADFSYVGSGGPGTDAIIARFTDASGALQTSNTVEAEWEVRNQPPTADAGPDQTVEATGPSTDVTLDGSGSSDPDGDPLSYDWSGAVTTSGVSPVVSLGLGTHDFTLTVSDPLGESDQDEVQIHVVDTTAPDLTFEIGECTLWPPNHSMRTVVSGISATDLVDSAPSISIAVTSNEDIDGTGDGATEPDWLVIDNGDGTFDVQVRAERDGGGDGRTYSITATATDAEGNASSATGSCTVPHDQDKGKGKG